MVRSADCHADWECFRPPYLVGSGRNRRTGSGLADLAAGKATCNLIQMGVAESTGFSITQAAPRLAPTERTRTWGTTESRHMEKLGSFSCRLRYRSLRLMSQCRGDCRQSEH